MGKDDCLDALEVMGTILMFTPIITAFPLIFYAVTTGKNVSLNEGAYIAGSMISAGFITLIYVSVKRFREYSAKR